MAGHRKWSELRGELRARRPDFDAGVVKASEALQAEIADYNRTMAVIRKARALTHSAVREELNVSESNLCRIESDVLLYLSTLARNLELLGAPLEVRATLEGEHFELSVGDLVGPGEAAPDSTADLALYRK